MTNEEKLNELCQWLANQGITDFKKDQTVGGVSVALLLPTQGIAVHLSDGKNQVFYRAVCHDYSAFFVRDADSLDFTLEKMQNCMRGLTSREARKEYYAKKAAERKAAEPTPTTTDHHRKRTRITTQRVTYNNTLKQ